jgi:Fe-S-cluster containining protein
MHDVDLHERYDCKTCGACCCCGLDIPLMSDDEQRFERRPALLRLTVLRPMDSGRHWRQLSYDERSGRCAALRGSLRDVYCSIYEDRPMLCREFEAGSEDCRQARARMGLA